MLFCNDCNKTIPDGNKFCPYCNSGNIGLNPHSTNDNTDYNIYDEMDSSGKRSKKKGNPALFVLFVPIAFFILIIVVWLSNVISSNNNSSSKAKNKTTETTQAVMPTNEISNSEWICPASEFLAQSILFSDNTFSYYFPNDTGSEYFDIGGKWSVIYEDKTPFVKLTFNDDFNTHLNGVYEIKNYGQRECYFTFRGFNFYSKQNIHDNPNGGR